MSDDDFSPFYALPKQDVLGAADVLLVELGMESHRYVSPLPVFRALGAPFEVVTDPACDGNLYYHHGRWCVRVRHSRDTRVFERRLAHESGHFAQLLFGVRPPHHEVSTNLVGLCVRIPARGLSRVIQRTGGDPLAVVEAYPEAYPSEVLVRLGLHLGGATILLRKNLLPANDGQLEIPFEFQAKAKEALRTGLVVADGQGLIAVPFRDPGCSRGVALVISGS